MNGHDEAMLSSIAERMNHAGQGIQTMCVSARRHAEMMDVMPGFKTLQEYDLERAAASIERALTDAREVLEILRRGRAGALTLEAAE